MEVKLHVLVGKQKDREIPLPETIFLIGRDRQCHLRPHCQSVSKLHCAIAAWAGNVRVRDLKSRNGTFLNGQPINGEVTVNDGDRLQVGTLLFAFRIKTDASDLVPPIRKGDVQWLLDEGSDSIVLAPDNATTFLPAPAELTEGAAASPSEIEDTSLDVPDTAVHKLGSKAISAGRHLREYLDRRNPGRDSAIPKKPAPGEPRDESTTSKD